MMRLALLAVSVTGFAAHAQTQTFTGAFASKLSFFSTSTGATFDVSVEEPATHCKTPCTLQMHADEVKFSVTRDGFTLKEQRVLPPGHSYVAIRSYSTPLLVAGVALMSVSATTLIVAAIFLLAFPSLLGWAVALFLGPAGAAIGVPGVVFTALAPRRQTVQVYRGEVQVP